MTGLLIAVAAALAGIAIGVLVSVYAMRRFLRSGRRSAGFVVASALMLGFPFMGDRGPALIEEARDETKRKKDEATGDPPTPE